MGAFPGDASAAPLLAEEVTAPRLARVRVFTPVPTG